MHELKIYIAFLIIAFAISIFKRELLVVVFLITIGGPSFLAIMNHKFNWWVIFMNLVLVLYYVTLIVKKKK